MAGAMMNTSIPQKNMKTPDVGSTVSVSNAADTSGNANTVTDRSAMTPATAFIINLKPSLSDCISWTR